MEIIRKRSQGELLEMVRLILARPHAMSATQIDRHLHEFCVNCPDPAAALDLVMQAPPGTSAEQIVQEALAAPPRAISKVSSMLLSARHPLRRMRLQTLKLVGGSKQIH